MVRSQSPHFGGIVLVKKLRRLQSAAQLMS
jgi:hypothetical protein